MTSGGAATRTPSARSSHAAKIRHEHFDRGCRRGFHDLLDAINEVRGTAVAQVVAVDAGHHDVAQLEQRDRFGQVLRLLAIRRERPAVRHIAERTAPRANVAQDHERRRALAEAFGDVRARGFLAHRVQILVAQDALDVVEARSSGSRRARGSTAASAGARRGTMRMVLRAPFSFTPASRIELLHNQLGQPLADDFGCLRKAEVLHLRDAQPGVAARIDARKGARSMSTLSATPW